MIGTQIIDQFKNTKMSTPAVPSQNQKLSQFLFSSENHEKQLQIVIYDCFEISRFATLFRDFYLKIRF